MPYLFIGAGQAGSAVVDDIFAHKNMSKIAHPLVFNSTIRDLQNLSNVDEKHWYGVAERHGLVRGETQGFEEQVTGGFGRNPVKADAVMERHRDEIGTALDEQLREPAEADDDGAGGQADVPFAFLFVGLGGGTGCGIAPYLAEEIAAYTGGATRIIAICILPNTQGPVGEDADEATPSRQAWNARYGLNRLEETVDGVVLVDNQRLAYHDAAEGQFTEYNEFIGAGIVDLVAGPILERIDRSEYDIDPPIIDLQDVVTALTIEGKGSPEPGYASMCRAVLMTKSLPGYLLPFVGRKQITATDLWDRARLKQTLDNSNLDDAQKAIGLLRAPGRYVSDNKYRIDTSKLRSTLTAHCNEVNLGVALTERNLASFTAFVMFEREDVERIKDIESLAEKYEQEQGAPSAASVTEQQAGADGAVTGEETGPPEAESPPEGPRASPRDDATAGTTVPDGVRTTSPASETPDDAPSSGRSSRGGDDG